MSFSRWQWTLCGMCLVTALAHAASVNEQPSPGGENNIFQIFNNAIRAADKNLIDKKDGMIHDPDGIGYVPARAAFLCPICREPLYKHADPKFVCVPKDSDGNALNIPKIEHQMTH